MVAPGRARFPRPRPWGGRRTPRGGDRCSTQNLHTCLPPLSETASFPRQISETDTDWWTARPSNPRVTGSIPAGRAPKRSERGDLRGAEGRPIMLRAVATHFFGEPRQNGTSPKVSKMSSPGDLRIHAPSGDGGKAKPYHVRQVLAAVELLLALQRGQSGVRFGTATVQQPKRRKQPGRSSTQPTSTPIACSGPTRTRTSSAFVPSYRARFGSPPRGRLFLHRSPTASTAASSRCACPPSCIATS